jgi:hypothetical protein
MFWHAGINKGAGKSDVGGIVDGTVVANGCHGLSVNLEYQLLGRPKYAIVMETGREILHELGAPSHARMFQILVSFGWILLQADVVVVWILDLETSISKWSPVSAWPSVVIQKALFMPLMSAIFIVASKKP